MIVEEAQEVLNRKVADAIRRARPDRPGDRQQEMVPELRSEPSIGEILSQRRARRPRAVEDSPSVPVEPEHVPEHPPVARAGHRPGRAK